MIARSVRLLFILVPLWVSFVSYERARWPPPSPEPTATLPAPSGILAVRVTITTPDRDAARITLAGDGHTLWVAGVRHALPRDASISVQRLADHIRLRWDGGSAQGRSAELRPPHPRAVWDLHNERRKARRYVGALYLASREGALHLVNTVDLEAYVAGVVTREYPFADVGGAEAMAILARTYALRTMEQQAYKGGTLADGTLNQVYKGIGELNASASRAADRTRGVVLTYGGRLAEGLYSSSNGGVTASNETVWVRATPLPYLRSRPDSFDAISPDRAWTKRLPRRPVLRALSRRFGSGVTDWHVDERSNSGRARTIALLRRGEAPERVSANDARLAITRALRARDMPSTAFEMRRDGSEYVLTGRGFGHGVGLSQYGAHGRANAGHDARQILAFYFPGTELRRMPADTAVAAR